MRGILTAALAAVVASVLVLAAVPPVDRDALTHHLAVPKLYLRHGGMVEIPHVPFSYYPMNLDLLYLVPLAFGNDIAPKYLHFLFALLTAGLIFSYLRRRLENSSYGLLGALLFLSLPVIVKLSVTVYVDLGLIFFSTASLLQLLRWSETRYRTRHLVSAGIFAGLCLGTKPNGMLVVLLLAAAVPFLCWKEEGDPSVAREGAAPAVGVATQFNTLKWAVVFVSIALVVFSPWMIRNFLWTGNPVYPMARSVFGPAPSAEDDCLKGASPAVKDNETDRGGSDRPTELGHFTVRTLVFKESLAEILAIPLRIFLQGEDDNPRLFDGRLNPYLLVFPLVSLIMLKGRNRPARFRMEMRVLGLFAWLYLVFAFFLVDLRVRYIGPILPPLVILTVIGIEDLNRFCHVRFSGSPRRVLLGALAGVVLVLLGMNGAYVIRQFGLIDPWSYLGGELSRENYIQKHRPEYAAITYANQHLPATARILLLFNGNRIYYIDRDTISDTELFRQVVRAGRSPEAVRDELTRRGISHLLVGVERFNRWAETQFGEREKRILQELFQGHFKGLHQSHGYLLLEIVAG